MFQAIYFISTQLFVFVVVSSADNAEVSSVAVAVANTGCQSPPKPEEPKLPVCGENEVATACKYGCPPDECASIYLQYLCSADQTCSPGCVCAQGFLRTNSTGVCIPEDRCLPQECANDPNAVRGCGDRCKKTCKDYNDTEKKCLHISCKLFGCDCKEGYIYDENVDICVKPKDCSLQCYGQNERYYACANGDCSAKSCDNLGFPVACPRVKKCDGGCLCKEGFARNKQRVCIPVQECPSCGGDSNAVSGCGTNCGRRCEDRNSTGPVACPLICLINGCDCKENFYYDSQKKKCVKPESCPAPVPPQCNGVNERYDNCANGNCSPKTCGDLGFPVACPAVSECKGGCICKEDYVRNSKGVCIQKTQCPSCGGDCNAESGCGVNCGKRCGEQNGNIIAPCPRICKVNSCDCKKGFYFDNYLKRCVKPNECTQN